MLTNEEHQAMIMFDRLLMAARDNDTIADLLDQTLNVARMIDPRAEDKVVYGPLQRMHFEWQAMQHRMNELGKKMDQYITSQNRWGHVSMDPNHKMPGGMGTAGTAYATSTWPSNPGLDIGYNFKPEVDWSTSVAPLTMEQLKSIQTKILSEPVVSFPNAKTNK